MKFSLVLVLISSIWFLCSCDHDSPYHPYPGQGQPPASFELKANVTDSASTLAIENIKVSLKPAGISDTLVKYTDSLGIASFTFKKRYGSSAHIILKDTAGFYNELDLVLYFSGRDFNAGIREFFVNL